MTAYVFCRFQFEGLHSWPDAVGLDAKYLGQLHRHVFTVDVRKNLPGQTMEANVIELSRHMQEFCLENFGVGKRGNMASRLSCAEMAKVLAKQFQVDQVMVTADFDHGGGFINDKEDQ